jgi:hypothetical protein
MEAPEVENANPCADELKIAAKWLCEADAVLICAGGGLSNLTVYTNPKDFQEYYPGTIPPCYSSFSLLGFFWRSFHA